MAGHSGNIDALAVRPAPEGFGFRPPARLPGFVEFGEAVFRAGAAEAERPRHEAGLLGSVVYRPMVFRRNNVGWIAACAWRAHAKSDDIAALKRAKHELDSRLIAKVAELVASLIGQLHGEGVAHAITCVPCGHSRRPDCLGKQIAEGVADRLGLNFCRCSRIASARERVTRRNSPSSRRSSRSRSRSRR